MACDALHVHVRVSPTNADTQTSRIDHTQSDRRQQLNPQGTPSQNQRGSSHSVTQIVPCSQLLTARFSVNTCCCSQSPERPAPALPTDLRCCCSSQGETLFLSMVVGCLPHNCIETVLLAKASFEFFANSTTIFQFCPQKRFQKRRSKCCPGFSRRLPAPMPQAHPPFTVEPLGSIKHNVAN